ncbi:PAS domain S-box protein [Chloroflexi bacterium TSY]|nr:PAS domain S-box protein [Chloroflexi bacterium TSY]
MFGYSAEEAFGRKMKHIYPEKSTLIADLWYRLLQHETLEQLIIKPRHKEGYEFWLGMSLAPIYDNSNRFNGAILIGRELSVEKRDMEELISQRTARFQAERERLNIILANMDDAVIFTGVDERIEYVNPAWEKLNGFSQAEVLGKTPAILKSGKTPEYIYSELKRVIHQGNSWQGELINRRKDDTHYEGFVTIVPVCTRNNKIRYFVGVLRDITKDKELARAKDRFVSDVSHELRTPLANIKFYLTLLSGKGLSDKGQTERGGKKNPP